MSIPTAAPAPPAPVAPNTSSASASASTPAASSLPQIKHHLPYLPPAYAARLALLQRGSMSERARDKAVQTACAFADAVAGRLGFPRRTIATAQTLYQRFHLSFPLKDFAYHDVVLATLYVASKLHDTLKKPREIVLASYAVRFPELLLNKAAGGKKGGGVAGMLGEGDVDPATLEHDRARVLAIERLVLESLCFNFKVHTPFAYVVKFGKSLGATKRTTQSAWRIAIDSHRTLSPLLFPPHLLAIAALYLASLLGSLSSNPSASERDSCADMAEKLAAEGPWEGEYRARVGDLEDVCHLLLDLFSTSLPDCPFPPTPFSSSSTSPPEADESLLTLPPPPPTPTPPFTTADCTQLKIALNRRRTLRAADGRGRRSMREELAGNGEALPAAATAGEGGAAGTKEGWGATEGAGKNEGSTRFLFD